mgnify:CR=1 FL=1
MPTEHVARLLPANLRPLEVTHDAGIFTAIAIDFTETSRRVFYAGISLISLGDSTFQGASPYPGPDATGEQVDQIVTPPHFYWVRPINDKIVFGLGLNSPFGLVTEAEVATEPITPGDAGTPKSTT